MSFSYCENCHLAFEANSCPCCGETRLRKAKSDDSCFLCEKQIIWGEVLKAALENQGIPVIAEREMGMGMALNVGPMLDLLKIYVPFSRLEEAIEISETLFSESESGDTDGEL